MRAASSSRSPSTVSSGFAAVLLASYGVSSVTGDRYAGEWPRERFRQHGIAYGVADRPKSDLYRDALPLLNSGKVELLGHPRLHAQLLALERRTARSGKDSIDHPPMGRDDVANAVCGCFVSAEPSGGGRGMLKWVADLYAKEVDAGRISSPKQAR
jgi:hypothetical protein